MKNTLPRFKATTTDERKTGVSVFTYKVLRFHLSYFYLFSNIVI